jgi:hypothetical protein
MENWNDFIFDESISFEDKAVEVFRHQFINNPVYHRFFSAFGLNESIVPDTDEVPLLPIRAFKELNVKTGEFTAERVFKSSGTGRLEQSIHHIADESIYKTSVLKGFERIYPDNPVVLAYLPGYLDNPHSSLIRMVQILIENDPSGLSRFLPLNEPMDSSHFEQAAANNRRVVLFGAAFGLMDIAEKSPGALPDNTIVLETGGMKTNRREISKTELYSTLADAFSLPVKNIHSEYGMAELLSQVYSTGNARFKAPPWMQISIRDADHPLCLCDPGTEGKIGIIDLANVHSCAFILTDDRGVMDEYGYFEVLGRWNSNDLRGCNFLIDRD